MNKIKFSHTYLKMPISDSNLVQLLQVLKTDFGDLSEAFLKYDTTYADNCGKGNYTLPKKGPCLVLLLCSPNFKLFTTIRRWTPEKEQYYRSKQGEIFELEITQV